MKKRVTAMLLALALAVSLTACGGDGGTTSGSGSPSESTGQGAGGELDLATASWDEIVEAARGTTVTFYGWGGDENRNNWLNSDVADYVREKYDITLEVVGMNIEDILAKLAGEKEAGTESGSIDMIWINGENFYSAKENGLLYGPFTDQLPNMEAYIDLEDPETLNDFCMPIEGYEAPYAKAQLVMYHDSAVTSDPPASAQELLAFCQANPGKVTYPAPPDFTGSAFVRNIIYELCGWEQFQDMEADYDTVKAAIEPALDYLRELNPYLWNQGTTFPDTSTTVDSMFADGELVMSISYAPYTVAIGIDQGTYAGTTQTFVFDNGTIGNTNYMAIAFDSPNKAGAMVVIDAILSAELQLSQYATLRELPVVTSDKLSAEEQAAFDQVDMGQGVLTQEELLSHRLPEMPADLVPVIEEIWLNEVVGQYNG